MRVYLRQRQDVFLWEERSESKHGENKRHHSNRNNCKLLVRSRFVLIVFY